MSVLKETQQLYDKLKVVAGQVETHTHMQSTQQHPQQHGF